MADKLFVRITESEFMHKIVKQAIKQIEKNPDVQTSIIVACKGGGTVPASGGVS